MTTSRSRRGAVQSLPEPKREFIAPLHICAQFVMLHFGIIQLFTAGIEPSGEEVTV